jgi:hypothetical protein
MLEKLLFISLLCLTIAFGVSLNTDNALAKSDLPTQQVKKAADAIVQDEDKNRAKEIYFKGSPGGSEVIDKAREVAREKLENLADKAERVPDEALPKSQRSFMNKFDAGDR